MDLFSKPITQGRDLLAVTPQQQDSGGFVDALKKFIGVGPIGNPLFQAPPDIVQNITGGKAIRQQVLSKIPESGIQPPTQKEIQGDVLKISSLFVPGSTISSLAASGAMYSVGQQLSEDQEVSLKRTALETAAVVGGGQAIKLATTWVIAPAIEKLSGLSNEALSKIWTYSKNNQTNKLNAILLDNKIINKDMEQKVINETVKLRSVLGKEAFRNPTTGKFMTDADFKSLMTNNLRTDTLSNTVKELARETVDSLSFRRLARGIVSGGAFFFGGPVGGAATALATSKIINTKATATLAKIWPYLSGLDKVSQNAIINALAELQ